MKTLRVTIEKSDRGLFGRIEGHESYLPVTYGKSEKEIFDNLRELIRDYQMHEKYGDKFWLQLDTKKIKFEIIADVPFR
jgi:hypothetical protein